MRIFAKVICKKHNKNNYTMKSRSLIFVLALSALILAGCGLQKIRIKQILRRSSDDILEI